MPEEQTPPVTSQSTISRPRRFQFSLRLLFIAVCLLAAVFALLGMQMRFTRERRNALRIEAALDLRAIVAEACTDLELRYGGGTMRGGPGADVYQETGLWTIGAGADIPVESLVSLEHETKRGLNELGVEVVPMIGLVDAPASRGIQVGYRYRSVRGLIQFRRTRYQPPEVLANTEGEWYLTGTHVQFR